jgi:hypothetical protein
MHKTEKEREEKKIWGGDASERERERREVTRGLGCPIFYTFNCAAPRGRERGEKPDSAIWSQLRVKKFSVRHC